MTKYDGRAFSKNKLIPKEKIYGVEVFIFLYLEYQNMRFGIQYSI